MGDRWGVSVALSRSLLSHFSNQQSWDKMVLLHMELEVLREEMLVSQGGRSSAGIQSRQCGPRAPHPTPRP